MRKEILPLAALTTLVLASFLATHYTPYAATPKQTAAPLFQLAQPAPTSTLAPTPTPVLVGQPTKLEIPKLKIITEIVPVGITPAKTMDVPKDASQIGWYQLGSKPGEWGAAILTGHYDTPSGRPAIFYYLRSLAPGDEIIVWTDWEEKFVFTVYSVSSEPASTPPSQLAYGNFTGKELRLITCDGVWDKKERSYSKRLVIFAQL